MGYQFEVVGHSQGGLLTHLLSDKSKNAYLVNPAYKKNNLETMNTSLEVQEIL